LSRFLRFLTFLFFFAERFLHLRFQIHMKTGHASVLHTLSQWEWHQISNRFYFNKTCCVWVPLLPQFWLFNRHRSIVHYKFSQNLRHIFWDANDMNYTLYKTYDI